MDDTTSHLPLVVTSATGVGGVAPPVSMLPEVFAGQTDVLRQAVMVLMTAPLSDKEAAVVVGTQLETVARSVDSIVRGAQASLNTFNDVLGETVRQNMEQCLRLLDDLATARSPSDAFVLHAGHASRQYEALAIQARALQNAFWAMFAPPRSGV